MKRILLFSLSLWLFVLSLSAQTIVYCPESGALTGTIAALNINKDTITYLQVSGSIDARDFKELLSYSALRSIDMSKVKINAYTGIYGPVNSIVDGIKLPVAYHANEIPKYGIGFNLERFVFPDSIKKVGDYLFSNHSIREIIFPPKLEWIGKYAFDECLYLNKLIIPSNLKYLGECAFRNCKELNSPLVFPGTLQVIGNAPFMYCTNIPQITFDKHSPNFVIDAKDVVYSLNLDTLLFFPPYYKGKYQMNPKTKIIKSQSVEGVEGLTALVFPDSLESMGFRAFLGCKNLKWVNLKNATTFTSHIKSGGPISAFAGCPIDTIYASCRQKPATSARLILLSFLARTSCKVFVPLDSAEVFKKDSLWSEFSHIYGIETMPASFDKPEITSFRILNINPQVSDATFYSATFEIHGNNITKYFLSDQSLENNSNKSYTINNDTSLFMVLNLDRRFDKRFALYGTETSGNKSKIREIVIKADMLNSVSNELTDKIQIYVSEGNFLNIINHSNQVLAVKVYSVLGNCIINNNKVLPGNNRFDIITGSGIYMVSVEKNGQKMILQKIVVK